MPVSITWSEKLLKYNTFLGQKTLDESFDCHPIV